MPDMHSTGLPPGARWPPALPREHGFWVMLGAAVLTAVARNWRSPAALIAAAVVVVGAAVVSGAFGATIRKREEQQVASAAALSFSGIPIDLAGGTPLVTAVATALAWAAVFTASAISARASFARAAHGGRSKP
jgi:hypothetical protein